MKQGTDTDIRELRDLIQSLDRKIEVGFANVDTKFANIDRKIEVGFANVDIKFANVDTKIAKLDGKIDILDAKFEGKIDTLDAKFEERTRLGFWGFIFRAVAISVLAATILLFIRYLFPDLAN